MTDDLKRCPRCEERKDLSEFGICVSRKDGLNLYCKRCIREKIGLSRQRMREMKAARRAAGNYAGTEPIRRRAAASSERRLTRLLRKLRPDDRVREAIRHGAHTQKEISHVTRLPKDEVCDVIANLLLWSREIRTQMVRHERMYFICEATVKMPSRKPMAMSFSSVKAIMPGQRRKIA